MTSAYSLAATKTATTTTTTTVITKEAAMMAEQLLKLGRMFASRFQTCEPAILYDSRIRIWRIRLLLVACREAKPLEGEPSQRTGLIILD